MFRMIIKENPSTVYIPLAVGVFIMSMKPPNSPKPPPPNNYDVKTLLLSFNSVGSNPECVNK